MPAMKDTSQGEAEDWKFEANMYHIVKCCPKGKGKRGKQRNNKKTEQNNNNNKTGLVGSEYCHLNSFFIISI